MSSDDRLEILMNQAEELVQAKKYEEAIAIFEQILIDFPENAKAWRKYGDTLALRKVNRHEEAYIAFQKSLQIEPDNPITLSRYANALASASQYERAFHIFEQLRQIQPDNPITLGQYANALASNDRFDKAWPFFERALEIQPDNPITLSQYANALASAGQPDKAWPFFERALEIQPNHLMTLGQYATSLASNGQLDKALQFFEQSLKVKPDNPITLSQYANALASNGQPDKAWEFFERSLEIQPNHLMTLGRYATSLASNGQPDKAWEFFERSLQLEPDNPITLSRYANALTSAGQHEKALQFFEGSLQLEPDNPITLSRYANALASNGQFHQALQFFERSLQLEPNDPITLSRYATALASTGQHEKLVQILERSLKIEPNDSITLSRYANALTSAGQPDKALEFFERSLQIKPDNPIALSRYANALASLDQYEKALQYFERSLQIQPQNSRTLSSYLDFQYALVLEKVGKHQEAIDQLTAIQIEDLTPYEANVIRVNLGRLYYQIKQPQKGNEYFEAAIANSDDNDRTDDKQRTLLYISRSILAANPYSEIAVEMLRQIKEDSPRYAQALEMLTLNLSEEGYFEMVKTDTQTGLSDTEMLNRAMYHKIANEISILKGIAYRILRRSEREDPLLSGIIQDIEDVFAEVDRRRVAQKSEIETIPHDDYHRILEVISKTAHNISDFVNNQLAIIESKTRRVMRKLQPSDPHYSQFEKLLTQLELTQTALSDLKAINEGITIKNHRFKVKKLFEKWETIPLLDGAQIFLDIHNGDSEFNGDEEKIKSALNELVENSLKHNSNQQNLAICMTSQDIINPPEIRGRTMPGEQKYLLITFSDNGEGVPEDKKDWIFQPLRTTSQEGKGSGLGLFIIRKTLTKMNGYIRETGYNGAKFEIYIPYKYNTPDSF